MEEHHLKQCLSGEKTETNLGVDLNLLNKDQQEIASQSHLTHMHE